MIYTEINIIIAGNTETGREITIAELGNAGFESFQETDAGVLAYVRESEFNAGALDNLTVFKSDEFRGSTREVRQIVETNWNSEWESNFQPVSVFDFCYIRSPYHSVSGKHTYELVIEPKMSFGTGHHATTWLMITTMREVSFSKQKVLDVGSGTGILAMLASLMGASEVTAVDIDEWAYKNALENLEVNRIKNCRIIYGDISDVQENDFDVILANITRNINIENLVEYRIKSRKGSRLILSGFYEEDVDIVRKKAEESGFSYINHTVKEMWTSMLFTRKE